MDYPGDKKAIQTSLATKVACETAVTNHKTYSDECEQINFDSDLNMEKEIITDNITISLQQVLTAMRSDRCVLIPIFSQVHWNNNDRTWIGICKKADFKLATTINDN